MNILFFIEPWIYPRTPLLQQCWLLGDSLPLCDALTSGPTWHNLFFLCGDTIAQEITAEHIRDYRHIPYNVISQKELHTLFPNGYRAAMAWYNGTASAAQKQGMQNLVKEKLGAFVPDVIFTLFTPVPYLRDLFPDALILNGDLAPFSRSPFPRAVTYDPAGLQKNGFMPRVTKDILATTLEPEEKDFLAGIRKLFLTDNLEKANPFTREQLCDGRTFKRLLLLPLNAAHSFSFNGNCAYDDQWDLLCDVLDKVPTDIGVIVTEHLDFEQVLTREAEFYLKRTYPHYIHLQEFNQYQTCSQFLLQHVDAIASVASSLCLQALLWKKPFCALGQCHMNVLADLDDIAGLSAFLDQGAYADKDALLYYVLTRLSIPARDDYLYNPLWLDATLNKWLQTFRSGTIDKDFFAPLADPQTLLAAFKEHTQNDILLRNTTNMQNKGRKV